MPPRAASPPGKGAKAAAAAKDAAPAGPSIEELVRSLPLRFMALYPLLSALSASSGAADAHPHGPCARQTAQAQAQKALAEAARVAAERADEAAAAARERAAREAKDRDDVLEHAARELGAAAAKTQALQARIRRGCGQRTALRLAIFASGAPRAEACPHAGAHQAAAGRDRRH